MIPIACTSINNARLLYEYATNIDTLKSLCRDCLSAHLRIQLKNKCSWLFIKQSNFYNDWRFVIESLKLVNWYCCCCYGSALKLDLQDKLRQMYICRVQHNEWILRHAVSSILSKAVIWLLQKRSRQIWRMQCRIRTCYRITLSILRHSMTEAASLNPDMYQTLEIIQISGYFSPI